MFNRLKEKWQVNWWQFALIFTTFALGGSACGYLAEKVLELLPIASRMVRIPVYIVLVTVLWPICVLAISVPFGQFRFFRNYIRKIGTRIFGRK